MQNGLSKSNCSIWRKNYFTTKAPVGSSERRTKSFSVATRTLTFSPPKNLSTTCLMTTTYNALVNVRKGWRWHQFVWIAGTWDRYSQLTCRYLVLSSTEGLLRSGLTCRQHCNLLIILSIKQSWAALRASLSQPHRGEASRHRGSEAARQPAENCVLNIGIGQEFPYRCIPSYHQCLWLNWLHSIYNHCSLLRI